MSSPDNWIANSAANWLTAADWDSGIPTNISDVNIGDNSRTATVTSSADVVINSLQIRNGDALDITNVSTFIVVNGLPFGMFGFIEVNSSNFQVNSGTINNSAEIELFSAQGINADLTIYNTVTLNGAGSIVFAGDGNGAIIGGQASSHFTNADNNISGNGLISGLFFTNNGAIETNNSSGAFTLRITGSANGGNFINNNSVYADTGGTLVLGLAGHASTIIDQGTIGMDSDGAVARIEIVGNLTIQSQNDGLIGFNGSNPMFDEIVSNGTTASLTLEGIDLIGSGILGDANLTLTFDSNCTLRGNRDTLVINSGANTINNAGFITSDSDTQNDAPSAIDIQSAIQNSGTIVATAGGSVNLDAATTNTSSGLISAYGGIVTLFQSVNNNGGTIGVSNDGTMIVHSSILGLNNSQIDIGADSLLDLAVGGTVSQGVTFTGPGAVLELDQNAGQVGTNISGFQTNDSIDLKFLNFAPNDHAVWTQAGTEGMVSIVSGNGSTLAAVVLAGSWNTQDFSLTTDDTGGTVITLVSPTTGTAANDSFHVTSSHNVINGDGGHDTVVFDGPRAEYSLTANSVGNVTVADNGSSGDGTSQLFGIQYLQFTDQTVLVENADNANIARLYSAAFNRVPDAAGLNFWEDIYSNNISAAVKSSGYYIALAQTNDGSGVTIADGFIQSGEFQHLYGTLNDGQFITQMYANVLGRAPDTAGYNFWLGQMQAGTTQAMVLVGFAESPENTAKSGSWLITT
jgi:Domain of unknown function (DUF4214)